MSQPEKMSREAFRERYPDIYEIALAADEIGPLKEQAIVEFSVTRSAKRVRVAEIHFSDLPCGHSIVRNPIALRKGLAPTFR